MAKRKIIHIDTDRCNGCGLCAEACHEGAIGMVDGKATLLRDDYCDGLGNCLPVCPTNAISFVEREAAPFDEAAVQARMAKAGEEAAQGGCSGSHAPSGCPGSAVRTMNRGAESPEAAPAPQQASQLRQWPVQLKLVPANAAFLQGARLLIAADCTAFAYGGFHERFMKNHITLIGCPKLDQGDYTDKLLAILTENEIRSVTVVRMEVPCCGGLATAAVRALQGCGKMIPWQVITLATDGSILEE